MDNLNLHITPSAFEYPSRILKETYSLSKLGLFSHICVVAWGNHILPEEEMLDDCRRVWRVKLFFAKCGIPGIGRILQQIEWTLRIIWRFRQADIDAVNCHSVACLPIGLLLKFMFSAKLIYDAHELETETVAKHGLKKTVAKLIEMISIGFVDATIVVNQSIADWYKSRYKLKQIYVVRNIPVRTNQFLSETFHLRIAFGISESDIVFLYQGLISEGRGIKILLETFVSLWTRGMRHQHIVFMGHGAWASIVKEYAGRFANIHYHESVAPNIVLEYTRSADVGICLIENVCLSYYLSLPNKLYEYILSGLPVIGSRFPEIAKVVIDADNGWLVQPTIDSLVQLIQKISKKEIHKKQKASLIYRERIGWQEEEKNLWEAFQSI